MNNLGNCCQPKDNCKVVNKCFFEEVPHYYNCHTHVVNTCVRKHIYIPTYSCSEETVYVDECGCPNMSLNQANPF